MDDPAVFEALLDECGLSTARQRAAIINQGFATCEDLSYVSYDDINAAFEAIQRLNRNLANNHVVRLTIRHKRLLNAIRREFIMRRSCDAEMEQADIAALDADALNLLAIKHDEWQAAIKSAANTTMNAITVPKLTKTNWRLFKRAFFQLVGRQRGSNDIPITYVAREYPANDYDGVYASTEDQLIACINLRGNNFTTDNKSFYDLLQQHTTGTEVESHVTKFQNTQNGRSAWKAVLAHCKTKAYKDNLRQEAMKSINKAVYKGEKREFGIQDYYQRHANAHNNLIEAGTPMQEAMKIDMFLANIQESNCLSYAITASEKPMANTFQKFYNEFYSSFSKFRTITSSSPAGINQNQRSVNQVSHDTSAKTGGRGRGGRGRGRGRGDGRGRGRGRGFYRGGRGGGRGGRGGRGYNPFQPRLGHYNDDEWSQLSYEEQAQVRNLRVAYNQMNNMPPPDNRYVQQMNQTGGIPPPPPPPPPRDDRSVPGSIYAPNNVSTTSMTGSTSGRAGDAFAPPNRCRE